MTQLCLLPFSVVLLIATGGDPSWRIKPVAQWNANDAKQLLAGSPLGQEGSGPGYTPKKRGSTTRGRKNGGGKSVGAPDWDGDYHAIAVYNVPGLFSANQKTLAGDLWRTAVLKDGKKDITPSRVAVALSAGKLATVVYLFPRSIPITTDDKRIGFVAQIGRLSLAQYFFTEEMQLTVTRRLEL